MSSPEPFTLVLVGPMAAGKTSIGRQVARQLEQKFVDTDKRVVAAHGPIPALFEQHGEDYFRERECEQVARALNEGGVISLGGGAVTQERTRVLLAQHPVVFLTVSPDAVARRIEGSQRPLLKADDPIERWNTIFRERRPWYEEVADLTVDTSRRPMSQIAAEIAQWRRNYS